MNWQDEVGLKKIRHLMKEMFYTRLPGGVGQIAGSGFLRRNTNVGANAGMFGNWLIIITDDNKKKSHIK